MQKIIKKQLQDSIDLKIQVIETLIPQIEKAANLLVEALEKGSKVLFLGNGGSAADAQHLAAELISRFIKERKAIPAIALTTDTSIITAIGNDYGFDKIFARQIEGLAQAGDVAFGISTSGNSKNVIAGLEKAKEKGCKTVGLLGCDGGKMAGMVDLAISLPSKDTPRIQESHITIGHILCGLIEERLFPA
ncbi:MAG: D-sedoheptulose 7-phosphate isomerase [Candidatus Margulisbacteria bacterium]|nr:D-sedoheptulose 7-phosphate isomerase [Candidatus Margulisiibacteriota bacterium]